MLKNKCIIYFGVNNPLEYKRGVENVILSQQSTVDDYDIYYIHIGNHNHEYEWGEIKCYTVKKNLYLPFSLYQTIKKIKNKYTKTVIHSHSTFTTFLSPYKTDILTVHDGLYYLRSSVNHRFKFIHFFIEKYTYFFKVNTVHFISKYAKNRSLYSSNRDNYKIIPNTTHLEKYYDDNKSFIKDKYFNIFTVRGIQQRTRIDLILDLADKIQKESIKIDNREVRINIAGKGDMLDYFSNEIIKRKLDNITLLGFIDDQEVSSYYAKSDLVIVTAEYGEGFGLPIIEAYLFNKPVIASDVCAIPDVVENKNVLFNNNVKSIFDVLMNIYNSKSKYHYYYMENFSNEIYKNRMIELYNSVKGI